MKNKLFATAPMYQKDLVDKYCFGDCGKAVIGGLMCPVAGPLVPCKQEVCPYEEATVVAGEFVHEGEIYSVTLRKLRTGRGIDARQEI